MQLNLFAAVSTGKPGAPNVGDDANATTGDAASAASEVFAGLLAGLGVAVVLNAEGTLGDDGFSVRFIGYRGSACDDAGDAVVRTGGSYEKSVR